MEISSANQAQLSTLKETKTLADPTAAGAVGGIQESENSNSQTQSSTDSTVSISREAQSLLSAEQSQSSIASKGTIELNSSGSTSEKPR